MRRRIIKGEAIVLYGSGSLIVAFLLLPLVLPFVLSVSDTPFVVFPPRGFTLQWYGKVLADPDFTGSFGFSVVLSLCAACGRSCSVCRRPLDWCVCASRAAS